MIDPIAEFIERWIALAENPDPKAYYFTGQVYYQMKDYNNAIQRIELAISMAQERGLDVRENWWSLLRFLYFEQENWDKVLEILEILVKDYPKRSYWMQLAGVYGQSASGRNSQGSPAVAGGASTGIRTRARPQA